MNYVDLGFLAIKKRDYQEAVNIFKRAFENRKEADAFFGFGEAHYYLGDLPTARWAFYQALELNRDHKKAKEYISRIERERQVKPPVIRQSRFRAGKDYLEIFDGTWQSFFVKGINIGLGLPGYFPGEYAIKRGTYYSWFEQIARIGVNTVRVYTVQPPSFYEALTRFNESGTPLYLLQGIWAELPEGNDFREPRYLAGIKADFRNAVDALYGNIVLPERPGYANGPYEYDVSPYLAGIILGREWESCAVKGFNELNQRKAGEYNGKFLSIPKGSPFEVWITERCDDLQQYEFERYGASHPISAVNWPTLDPLDHPSESAVEDEFARQGMSFQRRIDCIEAHDAETLDVSTITTSAGNGFFASYHVYPYYPDFMIYGSAEEKDAYQAYLKALKRHHGDQPVLIAEFGIPASRETAHWHPRGWDHGRHTDIEQGRINGLLIKSIHEAGMAGGVLFSWFDEWCKKTWLFGEYVVPQERRPFWFNLQDPEQNYGLLATYPGYPGKKVTLTCNREEWNDASVLYEKSDKAMAFRFNDGSDEARRLTSLSVQHDEGFLYLRLETAGVLDFSQARYVIGLDTGSSGAGERLLPFGTNLLCPSGLSFLIHLAGHEKSRILAAAAYDKYLNAGRGLIMPAESAEGAWVMMQNLTNRRRISKDGKRFYPAQVATMSWLRFGSLSTNEAAYNSLSDFFFRENAVELRIPWGLINFTDPSSKCVLWKGKDGLVKQTAGVRLVAVSYKPAQEELAATATGLGANHTDCLPADFRDNRIKAYSWQGWNTPVYHTFLKESYHQYRRSLAELPETP
jgi:hypothetical protein